MSVPASQQVSSISQSPVLLTGATGFIGRRIQNTLLDAGIPVRIIVRPGSRHRQHADPRCEVIDCHLTDDAGLLDAVAGIDSLIYCAGSVRGRRLVDFLPANVDGVQNLLKALSTRNSQASFLLMSSLAASRPEISDYANSKFLGEQAVRGQSHTAWTILRPPAVYGPGDTEMLPILKMARKGLATRPGPSSQRLSLLYADDLSSAVLCWLRSRNKCAGETFCIDDGRNDGYDWPAIMQATGSRYHMVLGIPGWLLSGVAKFNLFLSGIAGYAPMLTPGKVRELTQTDWLCDNTPFAQATGWQPQTGLATGIRLCLDDTNKLN